MIKLGKKFNGDSSTGNGQFFVALNKENDAKGRKIYLRVSKQNGHTSSRKYIEIIFCFVCAISTKGICSSISK